MNMRTISVAVTIVAAACTFLVSGCMTDQQRGYKPAAAKETNGEYLARDQADMDPAPGNTAQDTTQSMN